MLRVFLAVFCLLSTLSPLCAEAPLGLTGGEVTLGGTGASDARPAGGLRAVAVVNVTGHHALQGDVSYLQTRGNAIGQITAHGFMIPRTDHKFGLFGFLSDVDGRDMVNIGGGAEAMVALSGDRLVEVQGGLGFSSAEGLDFIFATATLAQRLAPSWWLELRGAATEVDEARFSATSYRAGARIVYRSARGRMGAYVGVTQDWLAGRDGAASRTLWRAGLTLRFGDTGQIRALARPFGTPAPLEPFLRRGAI